MKNLILVLVIILTSFTSVYSQNNEDIIFNSNSFWYFYEKVKTLEDTVGYYEDGGGMINHEIKISKEFDHIEIKSVDGVIKFSMTIDSITIGISIDNEKIQRILCTTNKNTKIGIEYVDNKITQISHSKYKEEDFENGVNLYGIIAEDELQWNITGDNKY